MGGRKAVIEGGLDRWSWQVKDWQDSGAGATSSRCWGIGGEGSFSLIYHLAGAVYGRACPSLGVYVEVNPGLLELGIAGYHIISSSGTGLASGLAWRFFLRLCPFSPLPRFARSMVPG